jgi:hypothetical protein
MVAHKEVHVADSTLERIKQLDKERTSLLDTAKKAALAAANEAITALTALGFNYRLISEGEKTVTRKRKSKSRKGTRTVKNAPCPICKFKTVPPHDARKHRFTQGKKKRPFTAAELTKLGLKKAESK